MRRPGRRPLPAAAAPAAAAPASPPLAPRRMPCQAADSAQEAHAPGQARTLVGLLAPLDQQGLGLARLQLPEHHHPHAHPGLRGVLTRPGCRLRRHAALLQDCWQAKPRAMRCKGADRSGHRPAQHGRRANDNARALSGYIVRRGCACVERMHNGIVFDAVGAGGWSWCRHLSEMGGVGVWGLSDPRCGLGQDGLGGGDWVDCSGVGGSPTQGMTPGLCPAQLVQTKLPDVLGMTGTCRWSHVPFQQSTRRRPCQHCRGARRRKAHTRRPAERRPAGHPFHPSQQRISRPCRPCRRAGAGPCPRARPCCAAAAGTSRTWW